MVVSPIVGQVLVATLSGFTDLDGIPLDPATGMPVGLTFEWQTTETGNDAGWATITTGLTYTVRPVDPGHILRAVAVFKDNHGVTERIDSVPTDNATAPSSVNENSPTDTVVIASIPFNPDYDPLGFGGRRDGRRHCPADALHIARTGRRRTLQGRPSSVVVVNGVPIFKVMVAKRRAHACQPDAPVRRQPVPDRHRHLYRQHRKRRRAAGHPAVHDHAQRCERGCDRRRRADAGSACRRDDHDHRLLCRQFQHVSAQQQHRNDKRGRHSWAETGDGANSPSAGQIRIDNGILGQNVLHFNDDDNDVGLGTATIQRTVNLAGVTTATLNYSFDENGFDAGEIVTVTFAPDGITSARPSR